MKKTLLPLQMVPHFQRREQGAIALFAALVLLALVGMIAVAIDSARLFSATEEKRVTADQVALGALETYFAFDPDNATTTTMPGWGPPKHGGGPTSSTVTTTSTTTSTVSTTTVSTTEPGAEAHRQKFISAVARAESIGHQNFLAVSGGIAQLGAGDLTNNYMGSGDGGEIMSGRWWSEKPASCNGTGVGGDGGTNPCPCNVGAFPCFQACDKSKGCANPNETAASGWKLPFANAMKVVLRSRASESRGIKKVFAQVFGSPEAMDVEGSATAGTSSAIAFALPKYGIILFDLGRGMMIDPISNDDMYRLIEKSATPNTAPHPMEVGYQLSTIPAGCSAGGSLTNPCNATNCDFVAPSDPALAAVDANAYETSYAGRYTNKLVPDDQVDHYKCFTISPAGAPEAHLVRVDGPEAQPFGSMLGAANALLNKIRTQGNPADRVSLVGFDSVFTSPFIDFRTFPRQNTVPAQAGGSGTRDAAPYGSEFTDPTHPSFLQLTDLTDPTSRQWRAQNLFFPRANAMSDIPGALNYAYGRLSDALDNQFLNADPFVILLSNGLTQCNRGRDGTGAHECVGFAPVNGAFHNTVETSASYRAHVNSMTEILQGPVAKSYVPNKIRLHVVFGGTTTVAHSVLVRDVAGGEPYKCLSDAKLRSNRFVNFKAPTQAYADAHFIEEYLRIGEGFNGYSYMAPIMPLYTAATETRGWFQTVRPPCNPAINYNGSGLNTVGEDYALDKLCANTEPPPSYGTPELDPIARTRNSAYPGTGTPNAIDGEGRVLCDPEERTIAEQLEDFAEEIMSSRPMYLVD